MLILFTLVFVIICSISKSDVLWSDPLNASNGDNGISWITGTNPSGSIAAPYTATPENCPNGAYCWELQENYYAYYLYPTLNHDNITLTVSISANSLETGVTDDSCNVYYSIDGSVTNWGSPLVTWTDNDQFPITSHIISLPSDAADNTGIGIKLQSESHGNGNKFDYCYFSDIIFKGDIITTVEPTTAMPTTPTPTTSTPTAMPTTSIPTTIPTTSMPTAPTMPTTLSPTLNPTDTTSSSATTAKTTDIGGGDNKGNDGSDDSAEYAVYGGIVGGVLLLICCGFIIIWNRKSKSKMKTIDESKQKMEDTITAQYMEAYKSGGTTPKTTISVIEQTEPIQTNNNEYNTNNQYNGNNVSNPNNGGNQYNANNQYGNNGNINQYNTNNGGNQYDANNGNNEYNPNNEHNGNNQYNPNNQYNGNNQYNQKNEYNQNNADNAGNQYNGNEIGTEETASGSTGAAPPIELRQIFGPPQAERNNGKDSDEDSIMKKQSYFSQHEDDSDD